MRKSPTPENTASHLEVSQSSTPVQRSEAAADREITAAGADSDAAQRADNNDPGSPIAVVGLGASAGGIKVLQTILEGIPADSGLAFVVVMHLSPDYESNLAQILQARTRLAVIQVNETVTVEPNCVYVIPPNKHIAMQDSRLHLTERQNPQGRRVAIDLFFRTLAAANGQRAVCAVLSGTDSDGVIGLKHIKEQGGVTIAQDPAEAEYDSMPRGAIDTGMVDWILPGDQIAPRLIHLAQNEKQMHLPPEDAPADPPQEPLRVLAESEKPGGPPSVPQIPSAEDEAALQEVLTLLRGQTGHDFTHYKRATVLRRIARRMQVNMVPDLPSYLGLLRETPQEIPALLDDLLINVTNFFRDPPAFDALQAQIPALLASRNQDEPIRAWVCGCATGEEAYAVAMLLWEYTSTLAVRPPVQIFATDIDQDVIAFARNGLYPLAIEADVSPERLQQFFVPDHGRYRVRQEIREMVLFASHDVLRDSPFSRLDLITCRNLLIYLKPEAQERVFDVFHFALRASGLLFLGGSESVHDTHMLFAPVDKAHRLYSRRPMARPGWQIPMLPVSNSDVPRQEYTKPRRPEAVSEREVALTVPSPQLLAMPPHQLRDGSPQNLSYGELHLRLLEHYAPPSVIVNQSYDIVHLSEQVGRFLRLSGGEPSVNLLKVVHPDLRIELRTALFRAIQNGEEVSAYGVPMGQNGSTRSVDIHVRPASDSTGQFYVLVVFEDVTESSTQQAALPAKNFSSAHDVVHHLEEEIKTLKAQLAATVEQYEASAEELKASNEELQAMNEELRSASEELQTSKEELQSVNEELTTVNHELKSNLDELSRVNSDLHNLLVSTDIGTIFLDRQLCIKRFTPRAQQVFNLIGGDVGRPLSDITNRFEHVDFSEDAARVLRSLATIEREVHGREGQWFLARLLPYRTVEDKIDGVVLTFVDITQRKQAEGELRQRNAELERFNRAAVGRELRMVELKREINELLTKQQLPPRYLTENNSGIADGSGAESDSGTKLDHTSPEQTSGES